MGRGRGEERRGEGRTEGEGEEWVAWCPSQYPLCVA